MNRKGYLLAIVWAVYVVNCTNTLAEATMHIYAAMRRDEGELGVRFPDPLAIKLLAPFFL